MSAEKDVAEDQRTPAVPDAGPWRGYVVLHPDASRVLQAATYSFVAALAVLAWIVHNYVDHPTFQNLIYAFYGSGIAGWILGLITLPLLAVSVRWRRRKQRYRMNAAVTDDPSIDFLRVFDRNVASTYTVPNLYIHILTKSRGTNFVSTKPDPLYVPISKGRLADLMKFIEEQDFEFAFIHGKPDLAEYYHEDHIPFVRHSARECAVFALKYLQNSPTAPDASLHRRGYGWRTYNLRDKGPNYMKFAYKRLIENLQEPNWPYLPPNDLDAQASRLDERNPPFVPPKAVSIPPQPVPTTPSGIPEKSIDEVASVVEQRLEQKAKAHATDQLISVLSHPTKRNG